MGLQSCERQPMCRDRVLRKTVGKSCPCCALSSETVDVSSNGSGNIQSVERSNEEVAFVRPVSNMKVQYLKIKNYINQTVCICRYNKGD